MTLVDWERDALYARPTPVHKIFELANSLAGIPVIASMQALHVILIALRPGRTDDH